MKKNTIKTNSKNYEAFTNIRAWAEERGLYEHGDVKTQFLKFQEESGEFARAIIKNDQELAIDSLGDIVVTLVNLAKLTGDYFQNKCEVCGGEGGNYEDVAGESGSKMWIECDTCAHGLKLEECIEIAYQEIKNRKGSMIDGSFVKE